MNIYDLIIIGAGPAGLTASIYASRYKLSNLVIGKVLGGELGLAARVCNYPGFPDISGLELAEKWKNQVEGLGAKVLIKEIGKIETPKGLLKSPGNISSGRLGRASEFSSSSIARRTESDSAIKSSALANMDEQRKFNALPAALSFKVYSSDEVYQSKALIVSTGSERRRLNIPREKEYMGRGVSYCHTCDAPFFREKTVAIIGGSDSAVSGAVQTAEYAKKVYIIYRKDQLRAEPIWIDEWKKLEASGKGETIYNTNIMEVLGDGNRVTGVKLDKSYMGNEILNTDGVFIEIGSVPGTALVQSLDVQLDETSHVIVNDQMETNIPGLFCAGDMIDKSARFKQAIWAMAQGALAAASAYKYLKKETAPQIRGV